jgi:hypothetical protein
LCIQRKNYREDFHFMKLRVNALQCSKPSVFKIKSTE